MSQRQNGKALYVYSTMSSMLQPHHEKKNTYEKFLTT